ncbi:MAG: hypothetical protein ACSHYA_18600 [Opitutaceae bacterium]
MKGTYCILLSSLLLVQASFGELVTSENPAAKESKTVMISNQEAEAYMNAIVIEDFYIHQADLGEALKHLDEIVKPHGLQIQFRPTKDEKRVVNLKTRDLSMSKNLSYLARQVGYDWWVDEGVIIVGTAGSNEALVTEFIPINSTTARKLAYRYQK